ncbi:MAG: hypothetical protein GX621_06990 [Pirellulaceae bacterium]|nr:hypothetical protein [Pirellulaceae bacterium]
MPHRRMSVQRTLKTAWKTLIPAVMVALAAATARAVEMPAGGIGAHRGASMDYPENTLAAFREAIWRGAQQIELDVDITSDGHLVIMHDSTVNRTTNGSGTVSSLTLAQIKQLDAGSWKASRFTGERVPTLGEVLAIMPENVWLNVHMKGSYTATYKTAMEIIAQGREHQAYLAVDASQKAAVLAAEAATGKNLLMCNMDGQRIGTDYVMETINGGFDFLQFKSTSTPPQLPSASDMQLLRNAGVKATYYTGVTGGVLDATKRQYVRDMLARGIEFALIEDMAMGIAVAEEFLYEPVRPKFRDNIHPAALGVNVIVNPGAEIWRDDYRNPTTASLPTSGVILTRDRELYGWNDVVEVTNSPYAAANTPSSALFPAGTFGKNAFIGGYIAGTRWIEQTIDLSSLVDRVDQGLIRFELSGWLGGLSNRQDYTALSASFQDAENHELHVAEVSTLNPEDWSGGTNMVLLSVDGAVPVGARSINIRLSFNGPSGGFANGLADNLSLVLSVAKVPGDVNADGMVDEEDVKRLARHWGATTESPGLTWWEMGDFNSDGKIDARDAAILAAHWGGHRSGEAAAVPEPSAVMLSLAATSILLAMRRRA